MLNNASSILKRPRQFLRTPFIQATLFLALFMLTDPPTAPARYGEQVALGVLVAVSSLGAQLLGAGQVYLLVGLLVGNVALAARRWMSQRQAAARKPTTISGTGFHSIFSASPKAV